VVQTNTANYHNKMTSIKVQIFLFKVFDSFSKNTFENTIQSIDLIIDEFKAQNASSKVIFAEKNVSSRY